MLKGEGERKRGGYSPRAILSTINHGGISMAQTRVRLHIPSTQGTDIEVAGSLTE